MDKTDIAKAISNYMKAIEEFKTLCIDFVNSIEEIPINRIGDNNSHCFSISFSTISDNDFILSPFYYNTQMQKKELIKIITCSKNIEFVKVFEEIAEKGKRTVRVGTSSYQQVYSPHVVSALKTFIKEENIL